MARVSAKENFLKAAGGGMPYYVPYFNMFGAPYKNECSVRFVMHDIFRAEQFKDGGSDMWGVKYVASESTGGATLPEPNNFMLEDICDWEKVIHPKPMLTDFDWDAMVKKDIEDKGIDRNETAVMMESSLMPFQQIMAFMGFENGLMALAEDPDAVKDLINFMLDHICPMNEQIIEHYKPDIWYLLDDTATAARPFISLNTYREIFKPAYERMAKPAIERGIPIAFHNCGHCEGFYEDMVEFGVKYTDPCQTSNDRVKVKEQFKGRMTICSGYDWSSMVPKDYPVWHEEEIRQTVRDIIDELSPGGGYVFGGGALGSVGDENIPKINNIIRDELYYYGKKVYGYTGDVE